MKTVLDRSFHYTPAVETDIRKTFARIRKEIREQEQKAATVSQIKPRIKPKAA